MKNLYPGALFSEQQILEQLKKVIRFHEFAVSRVLTAFLEFIVTEKMAGRDNNLKEYTIAVKGLGRTSSFNPQNEAVIRIYALRLRKCLRSYYHTDGSNDPIRISVPKGSYVPQFEANTPAQIPMAVRVPSRIPIAVFPFLDISANNAHYYLIDGLCEQLSTDMSRLSNVAVISYFNARHCAQHLADIREAGAQLGANMIVTGSVRFKLNYYYLNVQLVEAGNGIQLWARRFEQSKSADSIIDLSQLITRELHQYLTNSYQSIN